MKDLSSVFRAPQPAEPGNETTNTTIWTSRGNEYMALRPNDAQSDALLLALRDQILCTRIPPEDVDSIETLRSRLSGKDPQVKLVALVCGENLRTKFNDASPSLKGGCLAELYTHPVTQEAHAHLTYLGTLPAYEGQGIGKNLIMGRMALLHDMAKEMGTSLSSVFIEVCNDNLVNREKFFGLGARLGPEGFCRPEVGDANRIETHYRDMFYPVNGRYPDPRTIMDARACYWRAQGQVHPEQHPDFQAMQRRIDTEWHGFLDKNDLVVMENPAFQEKLDRFCSEFSLIKHNGNTAKPAPAMTEHEIVPVLAR